MPPAPAVHCGHPVLSAAQRALIQRWFPGCRLCEDLSWPDGDCAVVLIEYQGELFVVKAGAPSHPHIAREIHAYQQPCIQALAADGLAPRMVEYCADLSILALTYLPGEPARHEVPAHRGAARILRVIHDADTHPRTSLERHLAAATRKWLRKPHRIPANQAAWVHDVLATPPPAPLPEVWCHGDFLPRNWLVHHGAVAVFDFGRFGIRPAVTDFAHLALYYWPEHPELETAFWQGYGRELSAGECAHLHRACLREAVNTAAWAHKVGRPEFERTALRALDHLWRTAGPH
ncbi:MAG: aminoglycoside phosphotransferase family protein [Bowdeniella nasicola]|nr:aminoglycoside phosphotransferase family protein [Bowdeniella nasicola]